MAPIPRLKDHTGPALLSYGFRPFFLLGSLYAGLAILAWLPMFSGQLALATAFAPRDWHVHEMLYGFLPAIVTGFLLTAIPNWTGNLPLQGKPLLVLVLAWISGRVAVTSSAWIGWLPAALIDLSFLALVAAVAAREIISGKNWRNLKVLIAVVLLFVGNAVFHLEAHLDGAADYGARVGISVGILLVMLIGGRIIPSFTRNWLVKENPGRLPAAFAGFDKASLALSGLSLAGWVVAPLHVATGAALLACGMLQATRLARWAGDRTWRDPLVLILHVAYLFVPVGFVLVGLSAVGTSLPPAAGIHAWTGGALGTMTLAVMSRASLGHTGRALRATTATQLVYILALVSAAARICASAHVSWMEPLLAVSGLAWAGAFLGFSLIYWRVLTGPRLR